MNELDLEKKNYVSWLSEFSDEELNILNSIGIIDPTDYLFFDNEMSFFLLKMRFHYQRTSNQ